MAETIEFPSNGTRHPAISPGPHGGRARACWSSRSGGASTADQGDGRPAGRGRVRRARARTCITANSPSTTEMDKAAQLMTAMPPDRAARDMSGAIDFLAGHDARHRRRHRRRRVLHGRDALVSDRRQPPRQGPRGRAVLRLPAGRRWSRTGRSSTAPVRGHMAEHDDFFGPEGAHALEAKLQGMGKDVTLTVHPAPVTRSWPRTTRWARCDADLAERDLARGDRVPARDTR